MHDTTLLGRGIYDAAEVARLVRRSVDEVAGWAAATRNQDALLIPRHGRLLSFYDLVTACVVAELRRRDIPLRKIRDSRRTLAAHFAVDWPLAYAASLNGLATLGSDVYALVDQWIDAGRGGQSAIQEIVEPLLHRLDFGADGMASLWRPAPGVVVNPLVQAGAPCVSGTRISTEFLAGLVDAGETVDDIARDYSLDPEDVANAVSFERALVAA